MSRQMRHPLQGVKVLRPVPGAAVALAGALFVATSVAAQPAGEFVARLSGHACLPTAAASQAAGTLRVVLADDGRSLRYRLDVSGLENATMAHLHIGAAGSVGPVVAWIYPEKPPPLLVRGPFSGVLAEGSIEPEDLLGPLWGKPLADLVGEMEAGNIHINLHTNRYPGGEICGRIAPLSGAG